MPGYQQCFKLSTAQALMSKGSPGFDVIDCHAPNNKAHAEIEFETKRNGWTPIAF
jgi:hypothetical protein